MRTIYLPLLLFMLICRYAAADEEPGISNEESVIDEITVIGERDLLKLRVEIARVEDEIFSIFNELNEDDDYDMICKTERPVGTRIARRVCRARLFREKMAEDARRAMDGDVMTGVMIDTEKHNKILQEKLRSMALESPEFAEALQKRYALRQKYEQEHTKKFDK
ncbi:MAG: hypothetical protein WBM80_04435 [Woeseiaceae bacterium]